MSEHPPIRRDLSSPLETFRRTSSAGVSLHFVSSQPTQASHTSGHASAPKRRSLVWRDEGALLVTVILNLTFFSAEPHCPFCGERYEKVYGRKGAFFRCPNWFTAPCNTSSTISISAYEEDKLKRCTRTYLWCCLCVSVVYVLISLVSLLLCCECECECLCCVCVCVSALLRPLSKSLLGT